MKKWVFSVLFMVSYAAVIAQSTYVPLNESYYHTVDRYEIKTGRLTETLFTTAKPYKRSDVVAFLDSMKTQQTFSGAVDDFNETYLRNDNWEWARPETSDSRKPFAKHFYKKKSDFFFVDQPEFDLHVNPVLYLGAGVDSRLDDPLFVNTRGVEVRGMIDRKVGFYSYLTDNQTLMPAYISDYVLDSVNVHPVIPHEGFWKSFKDGAAYDFFQARGYISFEATRHINLQFGHDRFFFGNGFRSLIFSDFSPPAWFLKGNVKVWKLNYFFSTHQMVANVEGGSSGLSAQKQGYPNKFVAFHHLSVNLGKKFNLGFFESVVYAAEDSTGSTSLRLDYLNPVIFYRAIEQQNGSSDNVLLGLDFKWNALKRVQVYGQFVLDEFLLENLKEGSGWWANKYGLQVGVKYIDAFGLPNLDLQGEVNSVRPYTYSHNTIYGDYSSYRQSLAHPLGANFHELAGIVRYQPWPRLNLVGKLVYMETGRDANNLNFGGDILKSNSTRNNGSADPDYENATGQGFTNTIIHGSLVASYQWKHNLFVDAQLLVRNSTGELPYYDNKSVITSLALRWNIPQRLYDF